MTDEEKKVLEELKEEINKPLEVPEDKFNTFILYNIESAKIILNLIEKQSQGIELLEEENEKYKNPPFFDEDEYISKEESEQKERKAYIDGTNVAHELCNKKWEDKIKAKIGERMQKNNNIIHNAKLKYGKDFYWYDDVQEAKEENRICEEILESLLEKE